MYDALGTAHTVTLAWSKNSANDWTVTVSAPGAAAPAVGSANVQFGQTSGNAVAAGTIGEIGSVTGDVASAGYSAGGEAAMTLSMDFGSGPQAITLSLGTYGGSTGVTQYAGTTYNLQGLTQDGVAPGSYSGVSTQANGNVVVNYNNGKTRTVAQVPLITFNSPDALQRQNGQSFTATPESGAPLAEVVSTNGAGNLVVSSVESSNVDIAAEFSKLIVAQRAYSANTKVVTTSDELLQQTIDMKR